MTERGLAEFDRIDITSIARDRTLRTAYGYRAVAYDLPRGCAAGYMPERNVPCAVGNFSAQSRQPLMKHIPVEIARSSAAGVAAAQP